MIGDDRSDPGEGTSAASSLVAHIQGVMEHQKAAIARELHDDLGGLLVGAVMDLAWAEQHLGAPPAELSHKLLRARQTLSAAIDLKRRLIEDLRPTLLDNVGLFAALRWHVQTTCKRLGLRCVITLPEEERRFQPHLPIILFRIVQEGLAVIVSRRPSSSADFAVTLDRPWLSLDLRTDSASSPTDASAGAEVHYLAAIEQRVASLGGDLRSGYVGNGGTWITAKFPLDRMLATA